jgi:hypothetical protein
MNLSQLSAPTKVRLIPVLDVPDVEYTRKSCGRHRSRRRIYGLEMQQPQQHILSFLGPELRKDPGEPGVQYSSRYKATFFVNLQSNRAISLQPQDERTPGSIFKRSHLFAKTGKKNFNMLFSYPDLIIQSLFYSAGSHYVGRFRG